MNKIYDFCIDNDIKELITHQTPSHVIEAKAKEKGMKSLRECGIEKVREGITSLEEVISLTV